MPPNFGGLWEAAVKSFKTHLRRVAGEVKLTYEELATTLAQIEACLNSKLLIPLPESSEALEVLTPGHFLIEKPLTAFPEPPQLYLPGKIQHVICKWVMFYVCEMSLQFRPSGLLRA